MIEMLGLSLKVFLGNVLALWLQSSFLALTWEEGLQQPRTIKALLLAPLLPSNSLEGSVFRTKCTGYS